jgi:hypothetical protein
MMDVFGQGIFYAGARHSAELQGRLDDMKAWTAKRLSVATPKWARCAMLPAYHGPQLSQKFPAFAMRKAA